MTTRKLTLILAVLGLFAGGSALAGDLPRLPGPTPVPKSADSPGLVKFDHASHVDSARPNCVTCHPRTFSILGRSVERQPVAITHARMEKGEACGACHGKKAFGFDDCTMCHAQ